MPRFKVVVIVKAECQYECEVEAEADHEAKNKAISHMPKLMTIFRQMLAVIKKKLMMSLP